MGLRFYLGLLLFGCAVFWACAGDEPLTNGNAGGLIDGSDSAKDIASETATPNRLPDSSVPEVSKQDERSSQPDPGVARALDVDAASEEDKVVKFVAMGDTGKGNDGQVQVANAIKDKCDKDGCDFVMLLGDNIYDAGVKSVDDPQWQEKFEIPYKDVDLLFRAVLGNHDNGGVDLAQFGVDVDPEKLGVELEVLGGGTGMEYWRGDIQVDYSDVSEKWEMPDRYYDWSAGSAHFFGLDTNSMMFEQHEEQAVDMVGRINLSEATWKIAFGHHPYLSNGKHGNAGSYELPDWLEDPVIALLVGDLLGEIGEQILGKGVKDGIETIVCDTSIDLYISGHEHNRQWFSGKDKCSNVEFVVSGAGASTTDFENDQPSQYGDDESLGFVWIRIEGKTLQAQFIDAYGNLNFERKMQK